MASNVSPRGARVTFDKEDLEEILQQRDRDKEAIFKVIDDQVIPATMQGLQTFANAGVEMGNLASRSVVGASLSGYPVVGQVADAAILGGKGASKRGAELAVQASKEPLAQGSKKAAGASIDASYGGSSGFFGRTSEE